MKRQTRYQARVTKFVWAGNIYGTVGLIALFFLQAPLTAWVVYLSTLALHYCIAAVADAIFDSLNERVNIQSSWLDRRLSVIEERVGASSGQERWRKNATPTDDPSHYYDSYPEKVEGNT